MWNTLKRCKQAAVRWHGTLNRFWQTWFVVLWVLSLAVALLLLFGAVIAVAVKIGAIAVMPLLFLLVVTALTFFIYILNS